MALWVSNTLEDEIFFPRFLRCETRPVAVGFVRVNMDRPDMMAGCPKAIGRWVELATGSGDVSEDDLPIAAFEVGNRAGKVPLEFLFNLGHLQGDEKFAVEMVWPS